MKCNPLRWLYGLPLLAMWLWITFESERRPIETDLADRSQTVLSEQDLGWAEVAFDGRDSVLRGRAPEKSEREKATAFVRDMWGVRAVKDETGVLEVVDRYVWSATYANDAIRLSGFVPNEKTHAKILRLIAQRFPDARVEDDLKLARTHVDVPVWLKGITFGVDQLSHLKSGKVELDDINLSISGRAPTYAAYKDVRKRFSANAPRGVVSAKSDVSPPTVSPYTWKLERTATQIVLVGHVPSEKARTQLFEYVKSLFPKHAIIDRMETAAGAVKGWSRAATVAADQLALLDDGLASMVDGKFGLSGRAPSEDIAKQIETRFSDDVPKGFYTSVDLTYPEPKPPAISPFVTSVDVEGTRIVLFGYVPNEDERASVVAAVKALFPDRNIIDNLVLGSGEPQSWRACLLAGLEGSAKLGVATVRLSDRDIVVAGVTADEVLAASLDGNVRAAANRACTSTVDVKLNLPPEPDLRWNVVNDGDGRIVLDGDVPSSQVQTDLVSAAATAFPRAEIVDRMSVVEGYAKKWRGVALTGISLLAKLRKGRAILSGQNLLVSGEAADTAIASAVKGQLKTALVRGYTGRDDVVVRSDAMIWAEDEAKRKAAAEAAAAEAKQVLDARDARQREVDRLAAVAQARRKATEQAEQAEEARRREAAELARREADAERERARQAEEAAKKAADEEEARRKAVAARKRALQAKEAAQKKSARDKALREENEKRRLAAQACSNAIRVVSQAGVIQFDFASHTLNGKSHATLDAIAEQAKKCSTFKVIVSGHTDSVGAASQNLALSRRRAQSVVDYLVGDGVARSQLEAVGYGEEKPVAANDSRANRAKNRRIEFEAK